MLAFFAALLLLLEPCWGFRLVGPGRQVTVLASRRSEKILEEARRLREEAEQLLIKESRTLDGIKGSEFVAQFRDKLPVATLALPLQMNLVEKVIVDRLETERATILHLKKISGEKVFVPLQFTLEKDILASVTNLMSIACELEMFEEATLTLDQLTEKVAENLGWFGKPVFNFFVSEVSKLVATELKLSVTPEVDVKLQRSIVAEVLQRIQQSGVTGASLFEDILVELDSGSFALAVKRRFEAGGSTGGVKLGHLDLLADVLSTCTALNARIRSIEQRISNAVTVPSVPVSVVGDAASATAMAMEVGKELAEEQADLRSSVITLLESVAEIVLSMNVLPRTSELVSELKVGLISAQELKLQQHGKGGGRREDRVGGAGITGNSTGGVRGVRGEGWGMGLEEFIAKVAEGDVATTSAERLVLTYFDQSSRIPALGLESMSAATESLNNDYARSGVIGGGLGISRVGAGKFQSEVLRGAMSVTSVKLLEGAVIFEGTLLVPSSELCEHIERRLDESPDLRGQVGFTVLMSESLPSMDQGLQKMALDILLGQSPAVVVFPKAWNSTVAAAANDSMRIWWRNVLSASSVVTSFVFAANCFGVFDEKQQLLLEGRFLDGFVGLALAPIFLSILMSALETVVAKTKGINVTSVIIPTLTLFNFGSRVTYVTMPRNRDDLFDVAAITAGFSIVNSLALTLYGLSLTASASSDALLSYPKISSSLLQTNSVLGQLMANFYPAWSGLAITGTNGLGQGLSSISGGFDIVTGVGNGDVLIHVHWLVVVGGSMFISSVLQLLPIDNSWGSKMFLAVFGKEQFELLTIFSVFFKAIFFLAPLFNNFGGTVAGAATGLAKPRLILDFILASQLAGSSSVVSLAPPRLPNFYSS